MDSNNAEHSERFAFLLLPGFSLFALACVSEPLRVANRLAGENLFQYDFISVDGAAVTASNGAQTNADFSLSEYLEMRATIMVVSGFEPETLCSTALLADLRYRSSHGARLCGIDTGAWILAAAGLLEHRRATIHWEARSSFEERFPNVESVPDLFVQDGRYWTSAGGAGGLDMMLHLIRNQKGHTLASDVSDQFLHGTIRSADDEQNMPSRDRLQTTNSIVLRAVALMEQNKNDAMTISELADHIRVSLRSLERLFKRELNTSPNRFYRDIRLARARGLLQQTDLSILEIAIACGFSSSAVFSRNYREMYGTLPSQDRHLSTGWP